MGIYALCGYGIVKSRNDVRNGISMNKKNVAREGKRLRQSVNAAKRQGLKIRQATQTPVPI